MRRAATGLAAALFVGTCGCAGAAVTLERQPYGQLTQGDTIERFTLTNSRGVRVSFINYGAILTSIETPDRDGKTADIILGFPTLADYVRYNNDPHFGATLGRYAGRIANGRFELDGASYTLPINAPPNTLHSGPNNFGVKVWVPQILSDGRIGVALTYMSPNGESGFPGDLAAHVEYWLDDNNDFHISYQAKSDKPTVVNLTNHAYFNLAGESAGTIENHQVQIAAAQYLATNDENIPTGALLPVAGTVFDFRGLTRIGDRFKSGEAVLAATKGFDQTFVLAPNTNHTPSFAVRVVDPQSGRRMDVSTTQPSVQFYTGNNIHRYAPGIGGVVYKPYDGLALETQHYPDSPNHPAFPSTTLRPGQDYREETIYHFEVTPAKNP